MQPVKPESRLQVAQPENGSRTDMNEFWCSCTTKNGRITGLTHLLCLGPSSTKIAKSGSVEIDIYPLSIPDDVTEKKKWARHIRQHYCIDRDLDEESQAMGLGKAEFMRKVKLPDEVKAPGPSVRSGDFAEFLISDLLEGQYHYWVPRLKYANKVSRNESIKGTDIMGMKSDPAQSSPTDELIHVEVKAGLTKSKPAKLLQTAVDDAKKDYLRLAESMNFAKRQYRFYGDVDSMNVIERFQDKANRPYKLISGAAAVMDSAAYSEAENLSVDDRALNQGQGRRCIVVHGSNINQLVTELYRRAADEA